jgi:hypothetical protein
LTAFTIKEDVESSIVVKDIAAGIPSMCDCRKRRKGSSLRLGESLLLYTIYNVVTTILRSYFKKFGLAAVMIIGAARKTTSRFHDGPDGPFSIHLRPFNR